MKRDMDLIRKILFKIEEVFPAGQQMIHGISIEGYDFATIADHCQLLYEDDLINLYSPTRAGIGNSLVFYSVGNLTSKGYDLLDEIREDTTWNKTKDIVKKKGLPMVLGVVKDIASTITQAATQAAIKQITGTP